MPIDPLLLKQIALLRDFPDAALTGLAGSAMERKLVRREVVLSKGYQLQFFPFLLDGRLQGIDFTLDGRVSRGDSFGSVACFARAVNEMATALFAANRTYPVSDKTLLDEIDEFPIAPERFAARAREILLRPGSDTIELTSNVDRLKDLLSETTALVAGF